MSKFWSTVPFAHLYSAIEQGDHLTAQQCISDLKQDLSNLILKPSKNETSRKSLETGKVLFSDGIEYKLNTEFILEAIKLADELDLDELASAEVLFSSTTNEANKISTSLIDSAKAAYYHRREYILQIVSYILCASDNGLYIDTVCGSDTYAIDKLLNSFKSVEKELDDIKQLIERSKLLGTYNSGEFLDSVTFRRDCLFKDYQNLGEIFYGYISHKIIGVDKFQLILDHVLSFETDDSFITCFIPGLLNYCFMIDTLPASDVQSLHKIFLKSVSNIEELAESPLKAFIIVAFLTEFTNWIKNNNLSDKYDTEENIKKPILNAISVGALEEFMSIAAETSESDILSNYKIHSFYNYRAFLQIHIPIMTARRMVDIDEVATNKLKTALNYQRLAGIHNVGETVVDTVYVETKEANYQAHFIDFCAPVLSRFVNSFLTNCMFVLTSLRDAEEDSLLASDDFDLDTLAENADLERFYLGIYFVYRFRPELCGEFWDDKDSSSYKFLQWASRCNSPLIVSTFCLILSALASGSKNSIQTFNFLQLTNMSTHESTTLKSSLGLLNNFTVVSWASIYESFAYYNSALSPSKDSNASGSNNPSAFNLPQLGDDAIFELGEDSIIFLEGFFQLISSVAFNNSQARDELLESDDFYLLEALTDFWKNNTPIGGSALTVMSSLVGDNIKYREKIWNIIDQWVFRFKRNRSTIPREAFIMTLGSYKEVLGFATLISELFKKTEVQENPFAPYQHFFPASFGANLRKPGIWPYVEFLLTEVLVNSADSQLSDEQKFSLQLVILTLCERCLEALDPNIALNSVACGLKSLDNVVEDGNIKKFLQSDAGPAVMNFIYQRSVHDIIFGFASVGIDTISELPENSSKSILAEKSLNILSLALDREEFYINELIPILRSADNVNYTPANIGTYGFKSLYEALLVRLPLLVHISLYCGSNNLRIAKLSLDILKKVCEIPEFSGSRSSGSGSEYLFISKSRLLTMYETVDESSRIRIAFIEQLEAAFQTKESIGLKVDILKFINNNLNSPGKSGSISHFILGFDTQRLSLGNDESKGTILSDRSVFSTILRILEEILMLMESSSNIEYTPIRICALCLEIILKLCKAPSTKRKVLEYLRDHMDYNFFLQIISLSKKVTIDTLWNNKRFERNIDSNNKFSTAGESMPCLIAFIKYRSLMLELVALEIHDISIDGSFSLMSKYVEALADSNGYYGGLPKILEFLDVLEFKTKALIEKPDQLFANYDYEYIFKKIDLKTTPIESQDDSPYDLSVIDSLISLVGKESQKLGLVNANNVQENINFFETEVTGLKRILVNTISCDNFKTHHLQCLHSWGVLVQVLVNDGRIDEIQRSGFILEVFQFIIPKINDYLEVDVAYAEDLISLCVSLHTIYESDKESLSKSRENIANAVLDANRLLPMFKACIVGIIAPQSTVSIRSDLYVLASKYLQQIITDKVMITEVMNFIKTADQRMMHTVCNDSLVGEGPCKITALLLLEKFIKVSSLLQNVKIEGDFILELMSRNNYFVMLVERLKHVDELFKVCIEGGKLGITLDAVLYELTVFKSSIYFLIGISQTRLGAQYLLQCDIFNLIKGLRFLYVDEDIGFTYTFEEVTSKSKQGEKYVRLNLSYEDSLLQNSDKPTKSPSVSCYDILIPVFQLVSSIVISLGPQNENSIGQARGLLDGFGSLIKTVMKKDFVLDEKTTDEDVALNDTNGTKGPSGEKDIYIGPQKLASIFTLLFSLVA